MGVVERGAGWADLTMVEELLAHLKLTLAMLPKCMACHFVSHFVEKADPSNHNVEVALPVQDTQAFAVDANAGLTLCQLKSDGLEGVELFKHMVRHSSACSPRSDVRPSTRWTWPWAGGWKRSAAGTAS